MVKVVRSYPGQDTLFADVDDVKQAAAGMADETLACRELGHPWGAYTATFDRAVGVFERTLRCPRCETRKVQSLNRSGHILGSHYVYPDGYLMEKGLGRIAGDGRDALRLEALTRAVNGTAPVRRQKGKAS